MILDDLPVLFIQASHLLKLNPPWYVGPALVFRGSVLRPSQYSLQPHLPPLSSPCLHPSTRLSCCHFSLRGHELTLFTDSHAGVKYVRMQVCVLLFLSLNPFDHSRHWRKSVSTHRYMRNGAWWVPLPQKDQHLSTAKTLCDVCVSSLTLT